MKKQFLLVFLGAALWSTINSNGINPTLIVQVIKNTHLKTLNSEYNNNNIDEAVKALDKIDTQIKKLLDAIPSINPAKKDDLLAKIEEAYLALWRELNKFSVEFRSELATKQTQTLLSTLKATLNKPEIQDDVATYKLLSNILARYLYSEIITEILANAVDQKTEDELKNLYEDTKQRFETSFIPKPNPKSLETNKQFQSLLDYATQKLSSFLISPEFYNKLNVGIYPEYAKTVGGILRWSFPLNSKKERLDMLSSNKNFIKNVDRNLTSILGSEKQNRFESLGFLEFTGEGIFGEIRSPLIINFDKILKEIEAEPEPEPEPEPKLSPEELAENLQKLSVELMALSNQIPAA